MLALKFTKIGKKNMPYFRLIAVDSHKDPWGTYLENLGNYNPRSKESTLNAEKIKFWISKGAKPSASVHNLLVTKGIITAKKSQRHQHQQKTQSSFGRKGQESHSRRLIFIRLIRVLIRLIRVLTWQKS